jgi:dATP pyrophosphohydrolase
VRPVIPRYTHQEMTRAKFQVLIIPYRMSKTGQAEFALTRRSDMNVWQFLSGGGEGTETPTQAAKREANEEGGIPYSSHLVKLDSIASIPANAFKACAEWGSEVYVIPEYSFGVNLDKEDLTLSREHCKMKWLTYKDCVSQLEWDSNKVALRELHERITSHSTGTCSADATQVR